ncbi:MAG: ABC transporter ATP-binding protein [Anaerolineae bacterium]
MGRLGAVAAPGAAPTGREGAARDILYGELRRSVPLVGLIALVVVALTGLTMLTPLLLQALFDRAIPARDWRGIGLILVGLVAAPLLVQLCGGLQQHLSQRLGLRVSGELRERVFNRVLHARITETDRLRTGEVVYRVTREAGKVGDVYIALELLPLVSSVTLFVGALAVIFALDWRLSLFLLLALPLSYLVTRRVGRDAERADRALLQVSEEGEVLPQEVFSGLRTVRAFGGEEREGERFRQWLHRHYQANVRSSLYHASAFLSLGSSLVNNIFVGFVYGYGALRITRGEMTIGALVAFVAFVPRVYSAFDSFLRAFVGTHTIRPSLEKLDELLRLPLERVPQRPAASPVGERAPGIEFRGVSFHYDRGAGVEDLTFCVPPGEFVGIVGSSGGGKSTIIDLLLGFHEPEAGAILVDGVDGRDLPPAFLRRLIGLVPQDVFLWNASIRDNLAYPGHAYDDEAIEAALKLAELGDFVAGLPDGLDTIVGERGHAVSAGERQRLALARALLRQPRLILLDEATAALDAITEQRVRAALRHVRPGRTMIVVAHRLTTVMDADRILVVEQGRLLDEGRPGELLSRPGRFRELCLAQGLA